MKKLEKSIRRELSWIGPGLRAGSYGLVGHFAGIMPSRGLVNALYCDVDAQNGVVTDIRMYGSGDAREARDYYGESVNITSALEKFFADPNCEWDDFVHEIEKVVQDRLSESEGHRA